MTNHRDLRVWRDAQDFVVRAYDLTTGRVERLHPNVCNQLRRAAGSMSANIAEGAVQSSRPQFGRYLMIALGSAAECDAHLNVLLDIHAIESRAGLDTLDLLTGIRRQLIRLHGSVTGRRTAGVNCS